MLLLLIVLLVCVALFGGLGRGYYSRYQYGTPGIGVVGLILIVLLLLYLTGNLPAGGLR